MTNHLPRRTLLAGVGGLGALTLAGCGDTNASENRISFLNWQDYVDPALLTDFTSTSGLAVGYETYDSNDALAQRLTAAEAVRKGGRKATSFDLIVPSTNLFRRLLSADLLQPLDTAVVTEALLGNLLPAMRALPSDPGNRYSVPWANGTTGIGYDTRVFSTPPTWDVFLDATHKGKMSILKETREAMSVALISLGSSVNTTNAGEITAAEARLKEMLANASLNSATYLDDLADGKLVAAHGYNTDVLQAQKRNPHLAWTVPEAGGTRWVDVLCIPRSAPNAKGANRFMAYYLDPKVSAANAAYNLVATGNQAARQFVPEAVLSNPAIYPPDSVASKLAFIEDLGDAEKLYDEAWKRVAS